jgi:hypothetical protein
MPMLVRRVTEMMARILRFAAVLMSLAMVVSFVLFAVDQAGGASQKAQAEVVGGGGQTLGPAVKGVSNHGARHMIDEINNALASPFAAFATGGSDSWSHRGIDVLAGLLVYGLGLGALSRAVGLARVHPHHHARENPWGSF